MKKILYGLLMVFSVSLMGSASTAQKSIVLVSSNISFDATIFGGSDGQDAWTLRRDYLAQTLLSHEADIIATQEGREGQIRDLVSRLPGYQIAESHRHWRQVFYPSIVFRPDRVQVIESGDFWLSKTPDVPESKLPEAPWPRVVAWAHVEVRGQTFFVVSAHLNADFKTSHIREAQAEILAQEILRRNKHHLPIALLGDFNAKPKSRVREILMARLDVVVDPWIQLKRPETSSFNGFGKADFDVTKVGRIDWILTDRMFEVDSIVLDRRYEVRPDGSQRFPTDHYPVVCEICVRSCEKAVSR